MITLTLLLTILLFGSPLIMGIICAVIASHKTRSSIGWFFLGLLLNFIALIIILCLSDLTPIEYKKPVNEKTQNIIINNKPASPQKTELDYLEEISRYKNLYDQGVITEDKYNEAKDSINKKIESLKEKNKSNEKTITIMYDRDIIQGNVLKYEGNTYSLAFVTDLTMYSNVVRFNIFERTFEISFSDLNEQKELYNKIKSLIY